MKKKPIIFCDFDGTVTSSDNIISIMKKFAPKQWESIAFNVLHQKVSIQEGVGKMFSLLSTDLKGDIIHYLQQTVEIREGFQSFLTYAESEDIPFYIVSGGIDFFVKPLLSPFEPIKQIYCNASDFTNDTIKILWPYVCAEGCSNQCGCCKPSIIQQHTTEEHFKIVIGDSITDLQAAKKADFVLARDFLAKKCEELGIRYKAFETFYDCQSLIKKELEVHV